MSEATEPLEVDGVRIGPDRDLDELVRTQLEKGTVIASRDDFDATDGLRRLLTRAEGTRYERPLADAVLRALEDPDVRVRSGAAAVVEKEPRLFDAREVLALLRRRPELFEGVRPEGGFPASGPDLRWSLLRSLAGHDDVPPEVLDELESSVGDRDNGVWLLPGVVRLDPEWVADNAATALAGEPMRAGGVLRKLPTAEQRARFVAGLSAESAEVRRGVREEVAGAIADPEERDRLLDGL